MSAVNEGVYDLLGVVNDAGGYEDEYEMSEVSGVAADNGYEVPPHITDPNADYYIPTEFPNDRVRTTLHIALYAEHFLHRPYSMQCNSSCNQS